jgi:hypothetical protein
VAWGEVIRKLKAAGYAEVRLTSSYYPIVIA